LPSWGSGLQSSRQQRKEAATRGLYSYLLYPACLQLLTHPQELPTAFPSSEARFRCRHAASINMTAACHACACGSNCMGSQSRVQGHAATGHYRTSVSHACCRPAGFESSSSAHVYVRQESGCCHAASYNMSASCCACACGGKGSQSTVQGPTTTEAAL
jgi:hypothetical protein